MATDKGVGQHRVLENVVEVTDDILDTPLSLPARRVQWEAARRFGHSQQFHYTVDS